METAILSNSLQERDTPTHPDDTLDLLDGPIIIGGSGGSGTRAVARMFLALGVLVLVNDHNTWDVDEGFWVDVEQLLLPHTHGFDYTLEQIPFYPRMQIMEKIKHMSDGLLERAKREAATAKRTRWGFKAPCSQVFIPFFHSLFPRMKFVHVVRDGRDIALSSNNEQRRYIRFIPSHLFSHMNALVRKVLVWFTLNSQAHNSVVRHNISYMTVRVEDLTINGLNNSLSLLQEARSFINLPPLSTMDACCIFQTLGTYLGSFDRHASGSNVGKQYGKWLKLPATDQLLLERAVAEGLAMFGYGASELKHLTAQGWKEAQGSPFCAKESANRMLSCPMLYPDLYSDLASVTKAEGCEIFPRKVIVGNTLKFKVMRPPESELVKVRSVTQCCNICKVTRGCNVFEYVYLDSSCKLVALSLRDRSLRDSYFATGGSVMHPIGPLFEPIAARRGRLAPGHH